MMPDEIIAQSEEATASYYNALKKAEKPLNEAKLILIGAVRAKRL
jgi:hypothetical protein